MFFFDYVVEST